MRHFLIHSKLILQIIPVYVAVENKLHTSILCHLQKRLKFQENLSLEKKDKAQFRRVISSSILKPKINSRLFVIYFLFRHVNEPSHDTSEAFSVINSNVTKTDWKFIFKLLKIYTRFLKFNLR